MKNFKRCRTKFGMKGKLSAVIFGAVLALGFFGCKYEVQPATYTVTIASGIENGKVTAKPASAAEGETVTLTITPDAGYELDTLTVKNGEEDVTVTDNKFTMPEGNVTVTATFKLSYEIKSSTEAKVFGDIVLNDGRAISYKKGLTLTDEHKAAAIAIIFYKGTACNNDGDTTIRTLGVGLKQNKSGIEWASDSAGGFYENITTIQASSSGTTYSGDKNGSDNLEQIAAFLKDKTSRTDDTEDADKYPAFYFAKNYASQDGSRVSGTSYADKWYLPTIAELFYIKGGQNTVNAASELCGGDKFDNVWYWSSTQSADDDTSACYFDFNIDDWNYHSKEDTAYLYNKELSNFFVCAVREF